MRVRRLVAAVAVPLLFAAVGCSDKDKESAGQDCGSLLQAANPAAALPAAIPAGVTGATFYSVEVQGKTTQYFAYLSGEDLVATRDAIKSSFESSGFEIEGTDQEEDAEAELEWKGKGQEGTVQVIHLCKGNLRLRYRVGPA